MCPVSVKLGVGTRPAALYGLGFGVVLLSASIKDKYKNVSKCNGWGGALISGVWLEY